MQVRVACFDKTGTLTQQGLEFAGAQWQAPGTTALAGALIGETAEFGKRPVVGGPPLELLRAMACCHNLSLAGPGGGGPAGKEEQELIGSQVEVKMFGATGWELQEPADASGGGGLAEVMPRWDAAAAAADPYTSFRGNGGGGQGDGGGGGGLVVLRRFEFSHSSMTMSVVVRDAATGAATVYCKGAVQPVSGTKKMTCR